MKNLCISLLLITSFCVFGLGAPARAGTHQGDPLFSGPGLAISLISENASITPGQSFTVGLRIEHHEGFHTYWKNPGIVGVPTSIKWTLPEGFQASEISWPYPEQSFMAKYPCHGYERDVTLLVTITPPEKIAASSITLRAECHWMCCAKGCFPGDETFQLLLPVAEKALSDAGARAHIQKARSELPLSQHKIVSTLLSSPDAATIKLRFLGIHKNSLSKLYFFSSDGQISSDHEQNFTFQEDGSMHLTIPRSEFSPKGRKELPGVLRMAGRHLAIIAKPPKK